MVIVLGFYSKKFGGSTTALAAPTPKPPATEALATTSPTINAQLDKINTEPRKFSNSFPFSETLNGSMAKLLRKDAGHKSQGDFNIRDARSMLIGMSCS